MIPRRREEKRKREERARGMKHMASDLGTLGYCIPKLMESRAHQSASLVPLCFAQKQAVGIVSDSSTLRDLYEILISRVFKKSFGTRNFWVEQRLSLALCQSSSSGKARPARIRRDTIFLV